MSALVPPGLVRSIMRVDGSESDADLLQNIGMLRDTVVPLDVDAHVLGFIGKHVDTSGRVPDYTLVYSHFQHRMAANDPVAHSVLIHLNEVVGQQLPFWDSSKYRFELDAFKEEVTANTLGVLMQQASAIMMNGWSPPAVKGKVTTLHGPNDAINWMEAGLSELSARFYTSDIEGSFRIDAADVWDQYLKRKKGFTPGVRSGFPDIDTVHDGLMPGELCLVLGYTAQFKSTFCINWAYHAAVYYGKNVAIVPMEMSAKSLLGMLAVIHCYHPSFEQKYGVDINITSDAFRRGKLDARHEEVLQAALEDLQKNPDYGQIIYKEPQGSATVGDIFRWAERENKRQPLDLLVVDYLAQLDPTQGGSSLRDSALANVVVREFKKGLMTFQQGRGLAGISPWQSSREGYKEAEKNQGQYTLRAMSWANEAERSADFVYSVFVDAALKLAKELTWSNLKARDRMEISGLHKLFCNPETRVISALAQTAPGSQHQNPAAAAMVNLPPPAAVPYATP